LIQRRFVLFTPVALPASNAFHESNWRWTFRACSNEPRWKTWIQWLLINIDTQSAGVKLNRQARIFTILLTYSKRVSEKSRKQKRHYLEFITTALVLFW